MTEISKFQKINTSDAPTDSYEPMTAPVDFPIRVCSRLHGAPQRNPFITAASFPQPPEHLRLRTTGEAEVMDYLKRGHLMSDTIHDLVRSRLIAVKENARVLDFGCGTGALSTWLHARYSDWQLYGTDVDAESIAWAQSNLNDAARFDCNFDIPTLFYSAGFFDVVIALAVFTKPEDDLQSAWFEELARITRTGGNLIVSVGGQYESSMICSNSANKRPINMQSSDLGAFYRTHHQMTDVIRRCWQKFVRIEQIMPRCFGTDQALLICRK